MKYSRTPISTTLPYSTSTSSSSNNSGENYGTESSDFALITSDYVNRSIHKAKLYNSIYQRRKRKEK